MKLNYLLMVLLFAFTITGCDKDDEFELSGPPGSVSATIDIAQDDSGLVTITPSADNTRQFLIDHGDGSSQSVSSGSTAQHTYSEGTYNVVVTAGNGTGETTQFSQTIMISFTAPTNLVPGIAIDATNSAIVNVTPTATNAMMFDIYFGDVANEVPTSIMAGATASHTYTVAGDFVVRVVAKSASVTTIEVSETVTIAAGAMAITAPVDFESTASVNYSFVAFGPDGDHATVVANPDKSGINTSDFVVQFNKVDGAEVWAGSFFQLADPIDFTTDDQIKVKVWSPKAGAVVKLKVENLTDGGIAAEKDLTTTNANQWEELIYDFSDIDKTQSYQKIVIFFDFGNAGDNSNYYYDDVQFAEASGSGGGSDPDPISLPVDFESSTVGYSFVSFGPDGDHATIIDNPDKSGINTTDKVVQYNKVNNSEVWAGTFFELGSPIDFSSSTEIKIDVWSPKAGIPIRMKIENSTDGTIFSELDVNVTNANQWEELTFDFSGIDMTKAYHKIVLFFDFNAAGDDSNYYYDNVVLGGGGSGGGSNSDPITFPVDFESSTVGYSFVAFGPDGDYASVVDNPDKSGINTSDKVVQYNKINNSEVWAGSFFQLGSPIDLSTSTSLKVKVWSPKAGIPIRLKLENATDANVFYELDVNVTNANQWEELTYDLTGIDVNQSFQKVVLFFDFNTAGDDTTYYYDDVIQ